MVTGAAYSAFVVIQGVWLPLSIIRTLHMDILPPPTLNKPVLFLVDKLVLFQLGRLSPLVHVENIII